MNVLKILLLLGGTDHREAILLLEVVADESSDLVLLFNGIRGSLLLLERILEVLSARNFVLKLVLELKGEVSHNPEERWEVLAHHVWVHVLSLFTVYLQLFGEVDNQ